MTVPLCIDCDGTLLRTDLLHEAVLRVLKRRPWLLFAMLRWWLAGKAVFKAEVARLAPLDPATLPYREEVLRLAEAARAGGRPVVLATAAHGTHADAVAAHLAGFDAVLATGTGGNLAARAKAEALVARYGHAGFDYVGDSRADLAVWGAARRGYVVAETGPLRRAFRRQGLTVEPLGTRPGRARALLKALRPHQWIKNCLVFLPPLAGHQFAPAVIADALLAFVAFSLGASAVYLLNDLLDIDADRRHPRKRLRPFASGALPVATGLVAVPVLLAASIGLAIATGPLFLAVLVLYGVLTTLYSFKLKQQVMVDVMLLALLYTMRIAGGAAATHVVPSFWLMAFSTFLFFSLALVKRYSELLPLLGRGDGAVAGRGYLASDLPVLMAAGVASGMSAVMVLAFYVDSDATRAMYPSAQAILLAPVLLLYWMARLWMKTHRGEVHDDPVVFAARDWQTLLIVAVMGVLFLLAGSRLLV